MHSYTATLDWSREGHSFTDQRYSRAHHWQFDGGARVLASSSPSIVPLPWSDPAGVDPEEALVAATASCHMLFFLSLAAKQGWLVEHYGDQAVGFMEKNAEGKLAMTRICLRPRVQFAGQQPDADAYRQVHEAAHAQCFIANSLKAQVLLELS